MLHCATRSLLLLVAAFLLVESNTVPVHAGAPDSKGTDFWFTFLPNYHNNLTQPNPTFDDSLFIFIAASVPTNGIITMRNAAGQTMDVPFSITDVTKLYSYKARWEEYELIGYNRSGTFTTNHQSGKIALQSFHIISDQEVAVYALDEAETTSDAMMVLPTDVLGTQYSVLCYSSDGSMSSNSLSPQSTPSECAIVATDDNTQIRINPSAAVKNMSKAPATITLNKGDSYLLQADIESWDLHPDLTGTTIQSDKPIAVFAGHQRSLIPAGYTDSLKSRDYLMEQMLPISVWGKNYLLTPFPLPASVPKRGYDLYRVLAAFDNTEILIDDVKRATLQSGMYYEAPLINAATLTATKPVLVAQYKRSTQVASTSQLSDPFMLIIPPRKQFLSSYLCLNAQAYQGTSKVYREQYITIIAPTAYTSTVTLDDEAVDQTLFQEIASSCYSYAWVQVSDGAHYIAAEKEIGIYIYGYGYANSYGYVGGMAFTTDTEVPVTVTGGTTICAGDSARLQATGGALYTWTPAQDMSCTDCPDPVVYPKENTLYTVAITDDGGCTYTRNVSVDVHQSPEPKISTPAPLCAGDSVRLLATGGTTFHWSPATGLSCTDCPDPIAHPPVTTTYTVVADDDFGCTASTNVTLTILPFPSISIQSDTTLCQQDSILLMADGGAFYQWSPATGLSCTDCRTPMAAPDISTTYHVRVTTDQGCSKEDSVHITVLACVAQADLSPVIFGDLLLCDTLEQTWMLHNTGDIPFQVFSWAKTGPDQTAFSISPPTVPFPYTLKQHDLLVFHVRFQPQREGLHTAGLSVLTSVDTAALTASCTGWGHRRAIRFAMTPDTLVKPGDTVFFRISAASDSWEEIRVNRLTCEITHKAGWMRYAGLPASGPIVDPSWNFAVHERPGSSGDEVVTVIEASGDHPIATDGMLTTLPMKIFIAENASYQPSLQGIPNGKEECILTEASPNIITLNNCVGIAGAVRYRDQYYAFELQTGSRQIDLHYNIGLPGQTRLELFNQLGESVVEILNEPKTPGSYQTSYDLSRLPRGFYIARLASGIFSQSIPFVVSGE